LFRKYIYDLAANRMAGGKDNVPLEIYLLTFKNDS